MANYEPITVSYNDSAESTEPADMTFEQMYATYHDPLLRYLKFKFPNLPENEHEEVLQDAMLKAFNHFDEYVDPGHEREREGWIYTIVSRTALDRIRYNKIRPFDPSSDDAYRYGNHADLGAEADFDSIYSNINVQRALDHVASLLTEDNLRSGWLEIFKLYMLEDKTTDQVASILDIKRSTVGTRIHRIRQRLADDAILREILSSQES